MANSMALWEFILGIGFAGAVLYFCIPWLYGRLNRWSLRRLAVRRKCVVLTFDDGPGRRLTPAVLDLLAARTVKATFFLLGRNIHQNQDLVRLIRAQGHEIGSHTCDHLHAWKVAPWRSVSDIRRGFEAIDEALGVKGGRYPFRPPYGKLTLVTLLYLWVHRIPIVYWTTDSGDTWQRERSSPERAPADVGKAGGGVVLTHDFDRESDEVHRYVLDAVQSTLEMAQERGLRVSTFSQFKGNRR
jgi:peptidoglycan/xylan/chitin deacetylase (PgdA/CDA1 family)